MFDTDRATVKKNRYSRVVNVFKVSIGAITITMRNLNLGISFIVGKLLESALVVK